MISTVYDEDLYYRSTKKIKQVDLYIYRLCLCSNYLNKIALSELLNLYLLPCSIHKKFGFFGHH